MITAVDSNVLFDILIRGTEFSELSSAALERAATQGVIVVSDIVYAELSGHFEHQRVCDRFLESLEIRVQSLTREALFLASRASITYRRQGGKRTRILADFLIGAHAVRQAGQLLSRDRGFYGKLFPALKVIDPSEAAS